MRGPVARELRGFAKRFAGPGGDWRPLYKAFKRAHSALNHMERADARAYFNALMNCETAKTEPERRTES